MNSDNTMLAGRTLDYGPYGWVEAFDPAYQPFTRCVCYILHIYIYYAYTIYVLCIYYAYTIHILCIYYTYTMHILCIYMYYTHTIHCTYAIYEYTTHILHHTKP